MAKKSDKRRQQRRAHNQSAQTARGRERRQATQERIGQIQEALAELSRIAADCDTPVTEVADRMAVRVEEDRVLAALMALDEWVTAAAREVVESAGAERALGLAAALEERMAATPVLAWLAVSLREEGDDLDGAASAAAAYLGRRGVDPYAASGAAVESGAAPTVESSESGEVAGQGDADGPVAVMASELASIRRSQGRLGESMEMLERFCALWPAAGILQEQRARTVARTRALRRDDPEALKIFDDEIAPDQQERALAVLGRLHDRTPLYRLREAVEAFIESDPELASARQESLEWFRDSVAETSGSGPFDEPDDAAVGLAAERFWLEGAEGDDTSDRESVLGRFAAHPSTPPDLAAAAQAWLDHVHYGLWLGDWGPHDVPDRHGLWVTDIVTGRRVYAVPAPEQLEGLARWTVLVGALAPIGGVWRSGQSMIALDPDLADEVAESILFVTERVVGELAREGGLKAPRPGPDRRRRPRPHGVMADVNDPMEAAEAHITTKVTGNFLAQMTGMVEAARRRVPQLRNTDGDLLELITATYPVDDGASLRRRLLTDIDFEGDDGPDVRWLGRVMDATESATALARIRAQAATEGWGEVEAPDGPQRYLRGVIRFEGGRAVADLNSRVRLDALSTKMARLGVGPPTVERRIDPALDMAWEGARPALGRSFGAESDAAWLDHWVNEKVPALDGATPLAASTDARRAPLLERLLRRFEYDADLVAADGGDPVDVGAIREKLGMRDGIYSLDLDGRGDELQETGID